MKISNGMRWEMTIRKRVALTEQQVYRSRSTYCFVLARIACILAKDDTIIQYSNMFCFIFDISTYKNPYIYIDICYAWYLIVNHLGIIVYIWV